MLTWYSTLGMCNKTVKLNSIQYDDTDVGLFQCRFCNCLQALPGEKDNMIIIQCWDEEEPEDMHLGLVADIMLQNYQDLDEASDVRLHAKQVSEALAAAVAENVARHSVDRALTEEVQQESDGVAVLLPVSA